MTPAAPAGVPPRVGPPVRVKICGLRSVEAALAAAEAGADLLGFNFAPVSRRRIDASVAREAIAACRAVPPSPRDPLFHKGRGARGEGFPAMVGLFVNQPVREVAALAEACGLDFVQLSGDEDASYCRQVVARSGRAVIKTVRLAGGNDAASTDGYARAGVTVFLADATVAGAWGGTGQAWDWRSAAGVAARYRLLLAGGLTPENVQRAVAAVRPWGVDVASGVETDGKTNAVKVRQFIRAARGSQA